MNIRNLFFLGSILLLLSCKNSKQQEGYNSINIIKYINIYNENNRILTAQGTEYDYHRKVHLPIFGKLFKVVYTARFARTLSSLYSSGMPIALAISVAGKTIGNVYIEEQFEEVVTEVRSGVPLSRALRQVDGLMKKLASTILVGEESGRLDVMLDSIAVSMEEEAEQATKQMVTLLEPILIIFMALIVGFIMIAVMLPIYQSYAAIENA